jgi:formylmethanofuran dehydrogenase subunit E
MAATQVPLDVEGARRFHGHSCPGLSIGIRVAEIALREIGPHSGDEEVICIAETDNCALDAIQYFTGCTAGKGNLLHRDYGKNVFTFIRRSDGKAIRIAARPRQQRRSDPREHEIFDRMRADQPVSDEDRRYFQQSREARIQEILEAPLEELFEVRRVEIDMPDKAQILASVVCTECGEATMATRVRTFRGEPYCIPCFEALTLDPAAPH